MRLNHAQPHLGHRAPIPTNLLPSSLRDKLPGWLFSNLDPRAGERDKEAKARGNNGGRRGKEMEEVEGGEEAEREEEEEEENKEEGEEPDLLWMGVGHLGQAEGGNSTCSRICLIYNSLSKTANV